MFTTGQFRDSKNTYGVVLSHSKHDFEILLTQYNSNGILEIASAFKRDSSGDYGFSTTKAKDVFKILLVGLAGCKQKNSETVPFKLGSSVIYSFEKSKSAFNIERFNGDIVGCDIVYSNGDLLELKWYEGDYQIPQNIPYIKLTVDTTVSKKSKSSSNEDEANDEIVVRSVQEIALEKDDITWLQNKKYYIVNDDAIAEKIFMVLDAYNHEISYDTETTGLKINCFGKINSSYQKQLIEYNKNNPESAMRADYLVGIIFCIEDNVSYYFPCKNRLFKNLYEDDTATRKKIIDSIKARYTVGEYGAKQSDMADYIRNTPAEQWGSDVILMERVRNILQTKKIVAHNGSFEWKVGWQYEIDTNLTEDTMIMHQLMYKFRSTTSNRGEPSNLKYLSKVELGIDQWELKDFFPEMEDETKSNNRGKKAKKKKVRRIDFSYMTYEGTRVYAPTDGDATLLLYKKYKADMLKNHKEQEYLYYVEILVSCAIAYMEFYGLRINEDKIFGVRDKTRATLACIESEIRQMIGYSGQLELELYNKLKSLIEETSKLQDSGSREDWLKSKEEMLKCVEDIYDAINKDEEHVLNLASPAQVAYLFYDVMKIPLSGTTRSVAKKEIKGLLKLKDEQGNIKYPVVKLYSEYKKMDTLMTKFFDNLPYFMYPGGLIFPSFGQISTATGRMSCREPNAQQFPKDITNIVEPRPGFVMLDADYSQIEYRVLTGMAGNDWLAELFADPDSDYHTLMASLMYGVDYAAVTPKMRSDAKSFNFGIPYGMGFGSLAILLTGVNTPVTREEAKKKYEDYFKNQPKTRQFFDKVKEMAQVNGYTRTFWNRYRYYSFTEADGTVNNAKKAAALRQAGNAVIQGCERGDTLIQTKEYGIVQVQDVVNKHLNIWNGEKWTGGDILYSGKKRKCIITFSNGQKFVCSPIHKFQVISHRGKTRFVECQNLHTEETHKQNPHRIVINREYTPSDWKFSSDKSRQLYTSNHPSAKNVFIDDIGDSFKAGVVLGRLASDGNIVNRKNCQVIRQIIAEHEFDVAKTLINYMEPLGVTEARIGVREGRYEEIFVEKVHSKSFVSEVSDLNLKTEIHPSIMQDTEMLRGFLRGLFDGDGGISGRTITLVFGTQADFEPMCRQIQKALLFFGIRSRYYKYDYRSKITIYCADNKKFLDIIGFVGQDKQEKGYELDDTVNDQHIFGQVLIPKSVEITDEYIDMYDVCNTDDGYYVADGLITHNTAADIFKISVARNFSYIRKNKLFGLVHIVNMIHDEQLMEVNYEKLNVQRVLRDIGHNMQFKVEGFPPLYIGAGIGPAWGKAKGKMAEIHPNLLDQLSREADNIPLFRDENSNEPVTNKSVLDYFADRVYEFRRHKVEEYLLNPENRGKELHPAIGNLLNLQFTYGHDKEAEGLNDAEFTRLCVDEFIAHNSLVGIDSSMFQAQEENLEDEEEDKEYSDGDEDELDELEGPIGSSGPGIFQVIDDSSSVYGSSMQDLIRTFKIAVIPSKNILGIDLTSLSIAEKETMINYLSDKVVEELHDDSLEIVFLQDGNILNRTGVYVENIDEDELLAS